MSVHSMPVRSDAEVAGRVDALIAGMTTAEKAGQLTQFFYFDLPPAGELDDPDQFDRALRAVDSRYVIVVSGGRAPVQDRVRVNPRNVGYPLQLIDQGMSAPVESTA